MSADALPISAASFAQAIQDLPMENLYAKASEINNSIAHLQRSNAELKEYIDSSSGGGDNNDGPGDKDLLEAIAENEVVIERQRERVGLLRAEVERRGGRWHGEGEGEGEGVTNGEQGQDDDDDDDEQNGMHL